VQGHCEQTKTTSREGYQISSQEGKVRVRKPQYQIRPLVVKAEDPISSSKHQIDVPGIT